MRLKRKTFVMSSYSKLMADRRAANARGLSAFGTGPSTPSGARVVTVREGTARTTIFTIGYERRDGDDLVSRLREFDVDILVDVRERPFSRKPDFRKNALQARCEEQGIEYQSWPRLGSTASQRELHASGEISAFMSRFRSFARRGRAEELGSLASLAQNRTVALICYERCHADCHRSVVSELLAERIDASIVAIE